MLNNLTPASHTITLHQNGVVLKNETQDPLNTALLQNEAASQHDTSPTQAQINITNNFASEFTSESEPATFEQILKNIKLETKPTTLLNFYPQTVDLQKKFTEKLFKHKVIHCHYCKERWYDTKGNVDSENDFECHVCE